MDEKIPVGVAHTDILEVYIYEIHIGYRSWQIWQTFGA
jgi:hypothetical protein